MGVKVGSPLPQNGACKHFKKSLRWLRFPCCGKAFPCPICHDNSECPAAGIGMQAKHMLCGKCAAEQPYANKPCIRCEFGLGMGKRRSHWEGGLGLRDTSTLSKKDSRKHKGGSALKTTSKKSQRVGQAAKKKTEAAKAAKAVKHAALKKKR